MTLNDDTYYWNMRGVQDHDIFVMNPSGLPDKLEGVKFWTRWDVDLGGEAHYAVGRAMTTSNFE